MRRGRARERRRRRSRWGRCAALRSQAVVRRAWLRAEPPGGEAPSLERRGVVLRRGAEGLHLRTTDYHAGPVHLDSGDLDRFGLRPVGPEDVYELPRALALGQRGARLEAQGRPVDVGPGFEQPVPPRGVARGGFRLLRVRDGLGVYVTEYHATPLTVDLETLRALHLETTEE